MADTNEPALRLFARSIFLRCSAFVVVVSQAALIAITPMPWFRWFPDGPDVYVSGTRIPHFTDPALITKAAITAFTLNSFGLVVVLRARRTVAARAAATVLVLLDVGLMLIVAWGVDVAMDEFGYYERLFAGRLAAALAIAQCIAAGLFAAGTRRVRQRPA